MSRYKKLPPQPSEKARLRKKYLRRLPLRPHTHKARRQLRDAINRESHKAGW